MICYDDRYANHLYHHKYKSYNNHYDVIILSPRYCYRRPMLTSSNGNNFGVTGPLWGESTCHRWVDSPHKGHWGGILMFSLICAWTNGLTNHLNAGDLRRHYAHNDVTVMPLLFLFLMFPSYSTMLDDDNVVVDIDDDDNDGDDGSMTTHRWISIDPSIIDHSVSD